MNKNPLVMVFGETARVALGLPKQYIHPVRRNGIVYRVWPPDNHPTYHLLAELILKDLYCKDNP